ncbi:MAG: site-specific integrase [Negativicutes bacterium]|nr:site-specific integrase [Negativicutes bacterium]
MAKRTRVRASGEGTIYENEKMGRWEGQFSYLDPLTGETKRKKITGPGQKEVAAKGKAFMKLIDDGLLPDANKTTLWSWLDRWLNDYVKPNVRTKSYEKYESTLRCYIKPTLGNVIITKLKAPDVQRVFNDLLSIGGRHGKGVSSCTVRITRRYLSMAFSKAVQVGIVANNIIAATDPPKLVKEEIHPLTEQQAEKLLKVAKEGEYIYYGLKQRQKTSTPNDYYIMMARMVVDLTLGTGMRLSEVFGLKWTDLDFEKNSVNIQRGLVSSSTKGMIFEEPKTKGSRRRISITEKLAKSLDLYHRQQEWFINMLGDKYNNTENLIFTNIFGKPVHTTNFTVRYFKRMAAQAGFDKQFSFHDLRHTHATLLLRAGVNVKIISERLGHSTIQMTLDTYSHVLPDMQEIAVKALETIF